MLWAFVQFLACHHVVSGLFIVSRVYLAGDEFAEHLLVAQETGTAL